MQKSKEQLEAERKAILEQRIQPLQIDGMKGEQLRAKAKELNDIILRLEGDKYDLEQRFTRQSYDVSTACYLTILTYLPHANPLDLPTTIHSFLPNWVTNNPLVYAFTSPYLHSTHTHLHIPL